MNSFIFWHIKPSIQRTFQRNMLRLHLLHWIMKMEATYLTETSDDFQLLHGVISHQYYENLKP
jgi:uncharacterized membrane-anchored protein